MINNSGLKFEYKLFLTSFLLVIIFILSSSIYQLNVNKLNSNIQQLNNENNNLKKSLVLVTKIEKLKNLVNEFNNFGNKSLLEKIDSSFKEVLELSDIKYTLESNRFKLVHNKLVENILKLKKDFIIAKEQVPTNFNFRNELLFNVDEIDKLLNVSERIDGKIIYEVLLLRKSILDIEKKVTIYLQTNNATYIKNINQDLNGLIIILSKLEKPFYFKELEKRVQKFTQNVQKTIGHYRTYSMITKVFIPGDIYEISYYSNIMNELILKEISLVNKKIEELISSNENYNLFISIFYSLMILGSFIFILKVIYTPLVELTEMFKSLADGKETVRIPKYNNDDTIGKLISAAIKFKLLNKTTKKLLKETQDYKEHLEEKVETEIQRRREKEQVLSEQSKLASMGEMIGNIAHQWRQPLSVISTSASGMKMKQEFDSLSKDEVIEYSQLILDETQYLSNTIEDFRSFINNDSSFEHISLQTIIDESISLFKSTFIENEKIEFIELKKDDLEVEANKNLLKEVFINIFKNSKEAFLNENQEKNLIFISSTLKNKTELILEIYDNANGVSSEIINRILEPYFTTKHKSLGVGLGLSTVYKTIVEKHKQSLRIVNKEYEYEGKIYKGLCIQLEFKA